MVSARERARLIEKYEDEPLYAAAALAKAIAGLAIIAGIAFVGAHVDTSRPVVAGQPIHQQTPSDVQPSTRHDDLQARISLSEKKQVGTADHASAAPDASIKTVSAKP